jgi:hypothetical protein
MKMSNWRRKLFTALVAGGLVSNSAIAAPLDVNLVANADFENVDLAVTGEHNGPRILGWTGRNAFAYSHDGSSSNAGVVPDFAQGADFPNAGHWYFTPTNTGGGADLTMENEFYQDIDVSGGDSAAAIATGRAYYFLSAWLSSLANDDGSARVDLQFFDSAGGRLDVDSIIGPSAGSNDVWQLRSLSQELQPQVTRIRVSLFGLVQTGGPNGYVDNIFLSVTIPEPSTIALSSLALAMVGLACYRRRVESNDT